MNFRVIWLDAALDRLTRQFTAVWGTPAAAQITAAMARVDQLLEADPLSQGESRVGHSRLLFEFPISVLFEVHADESAVVITDVRYTAPRG